MSALPQYKSHKVVRAAVIVESSSNDQRETWYVKLSTGDHRTLGAGRVPDGEVPTGGYFVEYDDGYTSWSPPAAFEAGYMPLASEDWHARLVVEKQDNDRRLASLRVFLSTQKFGALPKHHADLLRNQEEVMADLSRILRQRLASTPSTSEN